MNRDHLQEITVLLVEDDEVNMFLARVFLKSLDRNLKIIEATNGLIAVEKFRSEMPDIVFMDVQMPEMNGFEATTEIRKLQYGRKTPIIALTAGLVKGEREKSLQAGMDQFLSKPFAKQVLENIFSKWFDAPEPKDLSSEIETETILDATHFDRELLSIRLKGNQDIVSQLLTIIFAQLDKTVAVAFQLIQQAELKPLKACGRQLKESALTVCFNVLVAKATALETLDTFDKKNAQELMTEIEKEVKYLKTLL